MRPSDIEQAITASERIEAMLDTNLPTRDKEAILVGMAAINEMLVRRRIERWTFEGPCPTTKEDLVNATEATDAAVAAWMVDESVRRG